MIPQRPRVAFTTTDAAFLVGAGAGLFLLVIALSAAIAVSRLGLAPSQYAPWTLPLGLIGATLSIANVLLWVIYWDEKEAAAKKAAPDSESIEVDALAPELAAAIRPLLAPGTREISREALPALVAEGTRLTEARERHARQAALALERENEQRLSEARTEYLSQLSARDCALLALRLQADAFAARDCARLEGEIAALRRKNAELKHALRAARAVLARR